MKKMKERDDRSYIYIEGENIIIMSHHYFPSNECSVHNVPRLRLGKYRAKRGSFKAASREKRKEAAFQRKRTEHGGFDLS